MLRNGGLPVLQDSEERPSPTFIRNLIDTRFLVAYSYFLSIESRYYSQHEKVIRIYPFSFPSPPLPYMKPSSTILFYTNSFKFCLKVFVYSNFNFSARIPHHFLPPYGAQLRVTFWFWEGEEKKIHKSPPPLTPLLANNNFSTSQNVRSICVILRYMAEHAEYKLKISFRQHVGKPNGLVKLFRASW